MRVGFSERSWFVTTILLLASYTIGACGGAGADRPVDPATTVGAASSAPTVDGEAVAQSSEPVPVTAAPADDSVAPTCPAAATQVEVAGRAMLLRQPMSTGPAPIVLAVHGFKGTPEGLELLSELTSLVGPSAIVAYPSGSPLDLGFGWNSGAGRFATDEPDDVAVLVAALDLVSTLPCADPSRTYLVGESNGGGMAVRATCDPRMQGRLAGVVLVNAAIDDGVLATCTHNVTPLPLLATAGRQDDIVPYDGNEPFLPVESWFGDLSQRIAGCASPLVRRDPWNERVEVITSGECVACARLYSVADGAHTWPGSTAATGGAAPGSFGVTSVLADVMAGERDACGATVSG